MDTDSNYEEEEELEHKVVTLNDRNSLENTLKERKKVVVVGFLMPGNPNCDAALKWMKAITRDTIGDNVVISCLNPSALPDIAEENQLKSVPTFSFYWRSELQYTFSGTNLDKFKAALGKALHARHETVSEEAKWHRTLKVMGGNNLNKEDKVHIQEILDTNKIIIGVGWSVVENDEGQKEPFNMDLYAFMQTDQGRVNSLLEIISPTNTQQHNVKFYGDSRKGEDGEGDDASWDVFLEDPPMPAYIHDIMFCGIIPDKKITLANATDFYIRGFDYEQGKCLFKYEIAELEVVNENCIYFGKVYRTRTNLKWKFQALDNIQATNYDEIEAKLTEVEKKKPKKKKATKTADTD